MLVSVLVLFSLVTTKKAIHEANCSLLVRIATLIVKESLFFVDTHTGFRRAMKGTKFTLSLDTLFGALYVVVLNQAHFFIYAD